MREQQKRIAVIGPCVADVIVGPVNASVFETGSQAMEMSKLSFGGDALNEAVLLRKLGNEVTFVSKVGNDETGSRLLDYLKATRVPTDTITVEDGLETGLNVVLVDEKGERFFLTNPNSSLRKMTEKDVMSYLDAGECLPEIISFASIFVSPLLGIGEMERIFRKIKSSVGIILTADMTKAKRGEKLTDLLPILPFLDYIFPNEEEIALLTGETDVEKNAELLVRAGVGCAVIKCGRKGCLIRTKEQTIRIPAYVIENPLDTTGAGDSFVAGFLFGLSRGFDLEDCARFGCAVASCIVECVGANAGIHSVEEPMKRFLSSKKEG